MAKTFYYKLNTKASVFYDPTSKLKLTNKIPGTCTERSKKVRAAAAGGHIIEIGEAEYTRMMEALPPATKEAIKKETPAPKAVKKEEPKKKVEEDEADEEEEDEDDGGEQTHREKLESRLDALKLKKKEFTRVLAMNDTDLEEYLQDNE